MLYRKMIWTLRIINSIKSGVCRASTWADFSKVSDDYDKFRIPVGRDFIAGMSQLYTGKRLQDLHILDIGCGTGQYAKEMLDLGVGRISLIDASPDMLNAAKYKLANEIEQGRVQCLETIKAPPLPFNSDCFDVILLTAVLPHLDCAGDKTYQNAVKMLEEANRVLTKNGTIVITTSFFSTFSRYWFCKVCPELCQRLCEYFPSASDFEIMFTRANLKCVQKFTVIGAGFMSYEGMVNSEGYVDQAWINSACCFDLATEEELTAIQDKVHTLYQNGKWKEWLAENDSTNELGIATFFVCQRKDNEGQAQ
ncbi:demethylmenaquinone methyltransferase-like isoform X2 [Mya arenaria]|uniref:demethylmenaquinone methyltransferase-like isoform X2 n=1 Tax=Mya arenaria TaxID=6604 RepID=UPI0022E28504|nr:demethylmenaquinone methyltransferase-like isoform X2 [Mya arenaria]